MFFSGESELVLPCERFLVTYHLWGSQSEAYAKAQDICLEQTVEFPDELVPDGIIREHILGHIESFARCGEEEYEAVISYADPVAAGELTQLLNVAFGNISIKPDIRVTNMQLPDSVLRGFQGPRFGRDGLREMLGVKDRPLLFTALKPMGLKSKELAELAYTFALGGIDIIKDDHGLSNQPFSPFEERVKLCAEAVQRANAETGRRAIYMPNITAPFNQIRDRASLAKEVGAGGYLISPGLAGLDTMRAIAEDDDLGLPIISHPAFQGTYVLSRSGITHQVLFGQIVRLAGGDGTIFPNFGGRFSFSREECEGIVKGSAMPMGHLKSIFPCPAGGMSLSSVPEALKVYGQDVIFLVGGGLFKYGPNLLENITYFKKIIEG